MDKNFISIDDLVRHRLEGAEERERSGAWMHMRELLDKEEQQRPIGFLYWRRVFSAVAVLLLLASISVGGYKMSEYLNGSNNHPDGAAFTPAASTANTAGANNLNTHKPVIASADNHKTDLTDNKTKNNNSLTASKKEEHTAAVRKDNPKIQIQDNELQVTGKVMHNDPLTKNKNEIIKAEHPKVFASNSNKVNNNNTENNKVNSSVTKNISATYEKTATKNTNNNDVNRSESKISGNKTPSIALNNNSRAQHDNKKAKLLAANKPAAMHTSGKSHTSVSSGNNSETKAIDKKITAKTNKTRKQATTGGNVPAVAKAIAPATKNSPEKKIEHKTAKVTKAGKTTAAKLALASHAPTVKNIPGIGAEKKPNLKKATAANSIKAPVSGAMTAKMLALNSHAPAKTGIILVQKKNIHKTVATLKNSATVTKPKISSATAALSANTPVVKSGGGSVQPNMNAGPNINPDNNYNDVADNTSSSSAVNKTNSSAVNKNNPSVAKRNNISLQKMTIISRTIRTSGKNDYEIDTNSIIEVAKEFAVINEPVTTRPATTRNAANSSTNNLGANSSFIGPPLPPKYLLASKYAAKKETGKGSLKEMGENAAAEKEANLMKAFNDIKYNAGSAKFAMGLTAGVNGAFFGPSSIKGFQFGATGDFIFGDTWSVLCELAYFNRVNNGYAINDNYYTAVQGGYKLNSDSYTFPTLQSFELPVSIRYHVGNFSFNAGVNFEYSLGINETPNNIGPAPGATVVSAVPAGAETAPKISYNDFGSRFGIGYLAGLAYQVSPNVTIDARNVQTVWDNANSSGSKIVSDQLFKSPSLQLSLIYRFGAKKEKN